MNRLLPAILLVLAGCQQATPARPPLDGARIGGPFRLTDGNARVFTERDLAGRYALVYFGYTFCPDVCPTDFAAIAAGLKQVEKSDPALAARIVPVFVTVDPERDTAPVVKAFAAAFHPRAIGLTGSPADIKRVAQAYGIAFAKGATSPGGGYLMDHSRSGYLMGPDGKPIALLEQDAGPGAVAAVIRQWVK
ncbi:SCO family protein [Sphingomonas bacterium]|uniref:SCO family protein n=1 Tax=Sphingomonas bacterium TaxID=1895847 RepID=UPI00262E0724|nr:SCO family protein [Sphingomonas bacterium]